MIRNHALPLLVALMSTSMVSAQLVEEVPKDALKANDATSSEQQDDSNTVPPDKRDNSASLGLADVIASVYRYFPAIQQSRLQSGVADGQLLSAMGSYDTRVNAYSLAQPQGFYRTYRHGLGAIRQTWWGGYVSAGYRIGRGDFEPWYKERETNRGGEFSLGLGLPLLQGRAIDPQRVAVFQAGLEQRAVGPGVQVALLNFSRDSALLYWEWVAAGAKMMAQDELLELAKLRQTQYEEGAEAGKYAKIDVVFNRQLVAQRANRRLDAEQKFRSAGFKLSFYLRDEFGNCLVADDAWLPRHFPKFEPTPASDFEADFQSALVRRPELALLNIEVQQVCLDRRLADNQRLPSLDLTSEVAQDVGQRASSSNDKGQLEFLLGIQGDVPLQRRNAIGKLQQANAKLAQLQEKIRLQQDKIAIELKASYNALVFAEQQVEQMEVALKAAFETLQGYRFGFQRGFTDLVQLNLLETQTNEIELLLIDAQRAWFVALAEMQSALGLAPLEQALLVAALPESTILGPGDFPLEFSGELKDLESDWKLHRQTQD